MPLASLSGIKHFCITLCRNVKRSKSSCSPATLAVGCGGEEGPASSLTSSAAAFVEVPLAIPPAGCGRVMTGRDVGLTSDHNVSRCSGRPLGQRRIRYPQSHPHVYPATLRVSSHGLGSALCSAQLSAVLRFAGVPCDLKND